MRALGVFWALVTVLALAACGGPGTVTAASPGAHPVGVAQPVAHAPGAARAG
jgi:hypothetical protein